MIPALERISQALDGCRFKRLAGAIEVDQAAGIAVVMKTGFLCNRKDAVATVSIDTDASCVAYWCERCQRYIGRETAPASAIAWD